jgi:hypothetical protein
MIGFFCFVETYRIFVGHITAQTYFDLLNSTKYVNRLKP